MELILFVADFQLNLIDSRNDYRRSTYIPVSNPMLQNSVWNKASSVTPESKSNGNQLPNLTLTRDKRELLSPVNEANATDAPITTTAVNLPDEIVSTVEIQKENSTDDAVGDVAPISTAETVTTQSTRTEQSYPHFHVTYWMFYPYSQVKSHPPEPALRKNLIFSKCLSAGQSNLYAELGSVGQFADSTILRHLSGHEKRFRQPRRRLGTHDPILQWPSGAKRNVCLRSWCWRLLRVRTSDRNIWFSASRITQRHFATSKFPAHGDHIEKPSRSILGPGQPWPVDGTGQTSICTRRPFIRCKRFRYGMADMETSGSFVRKW